jgi:hypothetical protein
VRDLSACLPTGHRSLGWLFNRFHGKLEFSAFVQADGLDFDDLPFAEYVLDLVNAVVGDFRDVHQPLGVGQDFHERREIHDTEDGADFNLLRNLPDQCQ